MGPDARRLWVALVTFERDQTEQDVLPDWAHGACGWLAALASDEAAARSHLVQDLRHRDLRVVEVDKLHEVFGEEDVEHLDKHLAANLRALRPGGRTVWGTIHCYKGDGEA